MTDLMVSSLTDEGGNSELTYELISVRLVAQMTTSSPPRLLFVVAGTFLVLGLTVGWIFLQRPCGEIDLNDPGRLLLEEMAATFRSGARRLLPTAARLREPAVPKKGSPTEEISEVFYPSKKKLG
jgi:hypothetical protein